MAKAERSEYVSEEKYQRMFAPDESDPCFSDVREWFTTRASHIDSSEPQAFVARLTSLKVDAAAALASFFSMRSKLRNKAAHLYLAESELPQPITAQIKGKTVTFESEQEKFDALMQFWRELREPGSSTDDLHNPAYLQIIGMGKIAVPFLLREVHRQTGHWFSALTFITGISVSPEPPGRIPQLRSAWLKWGRENGYDAYYSEGSVAEKTSASSKGKRLWMGK